MSKENLENRLADLEKAFNVLKEEHATLSRQLSENQAKQIEIRGAYGEIPKLLEDSKPPKKAEKYTLKTTLQYFKHIIGIEGEDQSFLQIC